MSSKCINENLTRAIAIAIACHLLVGGAFSAVGIAVYDMTGAEYLPGGAGHHPTCHSSALASTSTCFIKLPV